MRLLAPVLGLALVFTALGLYREYTRPLPESLEEYYLRLYPNQLYVGPDLDKVTYDYPQLLEKARAVLVVTPEEDLPQTGTGYIEDKNYAGTNPRLKYRFYMPRTCRWVTVLRVLKGESEPGDRLSIYERCVLVGGLDRLLAREDEAWPMIKGCAYLLFLDRDPAGEDYPFLAMPVSYGNGWFDLTHLSLNDARYMAVLRNALQDLGLLDPEAAGIAAPWTDRRYALETA